MLRFLATKMRLRRLLGSTKSAGRSVEWSKHAAACEAAERTLSEASKQALSDRVSCRRCRRLPLYNSLNEPILCVILGASTPLRLYLKPEKR